MKKIIPSVVAVAVGILVLMSYFFNGPSLLSLRVLFTDWAITLAGLAVLLGVINVLRNNARRIDERASGWPYYAVTLAALVATVAVGLVEGLFNQGGALYMNNTASALLVNGIVIGSQAALTGLIVFALVMSLVRMIQGTPTLWTWLFTGAVIIALIGWLPLLGPVTGFYQWLLDVPVVAGARGILIGVALGTIVIGIRIIMGYQRPYRD